jgi:cbb3-type cytochrome oxidase subunit 3
MYKWLLLLYLLWVFISMSYYMYGQTKQEQRHHAGDEAKRDGRSTSSSSLD